MFAINYNKAEIETKQFGAMAASKEQNITIPFTGDIVKEAAIDAVNRWLYASEEFTWVKSFGADSENLYVVASNTRH